MHTALLPVLLLPFLLQPSRQSSSDSPKPTQFLPNSPRPDPEGVYRVGNGVSAPKLLSAPDPEFSEQARKKKIAGDCRVSLIVDVDGSVKDVKVIRSAAEGQPPKLRAAAQSLDEKAVEAVQQYRFEPGLRNGKPVPVALIIDVNFQIF